VSERSPDRPTTFDLLSVADAPALEPDAHWPPPERFPTNEAGRQVAVTVVADLRDAADPLLISGYAALDALLDFLATLPADRPARLLLGHEPHPSARTSFRLAQVDLPEEIERYWLERGVSLELSARLLVVIEGLRSGRLRAGIVEGRRALHAKIYLGDDAVTLGSSNFSASGLRLHHEANARFTADAEPARFTEARTLAENYWAMASDYGPRLVALLERLLRATEWPRTLARACAELLEGEWAEPWMRQGLLDDASSLWPSQRQGIAQALYVLSRQGSVLVADATGSGKTRLGVHLVGATLTDIVRSGRLRQGRATMVCPPLVAGSWTREAQGAGVPIDVISHGRLSHRRARDHDAVVDSLRRAQVLCVDEGHNFLNVASNRSRELLRNLADHVVVFTATPLNRSPADLLRIADLLGADNLDPRVFRTFQRMLGSRHLTRALSPDEIGMLREEITRFTVRRTKRQLNALIDREPEAYVDADGRPCRFPGHRARTYALGESDATRATARRIGEVADRLRGVAHFQRPLVMPDALRRQGVTETRYLEARLRSAHLLSRHMVMRSLRSSRAALMEHLTGTVATVERLALEGFRKATDTGNVIDTLGRIAGTPPRSRLEVELPEWLRDPDAHRAACLEDAACYREILAELEALGDEREIAKARRLLHVAADHELVLGFDARPITLAVIEQAVRRLAPEADVVVATGDRGSDRDRALAAFARGSTAWGVIGLCSDSLSEGVNLQQASALVHLDMPSVVRIAEQRVGRVDRMDSPHAMIEAWWPEDAPEFALTSDERFMERFETVDRLLGANMPLPESMTEGRPVSAADQIADAEAADAAAPWDRIEDAFAPVRDCVEGEDALIPTGVYDEVREELRRVRRHFSVVPAATPWMFLCLTSGSFGAPRWLLVPAPEAAPVTDLEAIATGLRARLDPSVDSLVIDERIEATQARFLERLPIIERELLPRRKQRALEELQAVIEAFLEAGALGRWTEELDRLERLRALLTGRVAGAPPDWDEIATRWLDLIRPTWFELLARPRRTRPLRLRDIRGTLIEQGEGLIVRIAGLFAEVPRLPPVEERISACILGLPTAE
jgi:superfamily II DNA or RNA helicase